jgi:hypothetical protein
MNKDFWKNVAKVVGVVIALTAVALLMYWFGRHRGAL